MENNYYSGLLRSEKGETLGEDYNRMISPTYWGLAIIIGIVITEFDGLVKRWNEDKLLLSFSVIILLLAFWRTRQSLVLALIDYKYLPKKNYDSIILTVVSLLILYGGLVYLLCNHIDYYFFAYSFISLLATFNFISLYQRIYKEKSGFDYLSEMRIQLFNASVFLLLTILFCIIGVVKYRSIPNMEHVYVILSIVICILLILNVYHSHALTYYPKIILSNALDIGKTNTGQLIKIQRTEPDEIKRIAIDLVNEFSYVFEYIFAEKQSKLLKKYVYILLTSSFGFGDWGYMRFYNIINEQGIKVGWIRIDTAHGCWIYTILEKLMLFIRFSCCLGVKKLCGVAQRTYNIIKEQPKVNKDTFVLSYIVIKKPYRQMKYGYYTIELLKNAFFNSQTNNIKVKRLSLLVRSYNTASIALFRKSKFKETVSSSPQQDIIYFHYEDM